MTVTTTTDRKAPITTKYQLKEGRSHPLGATPDQNGVNFSLFSEHATYVELLIFDCPSAAEPTQVIQLDPTINKTFQ